MKNLKHVVLAALLVFTSAHSFAAGSASIKNKKLVSALQKNTAVMGALSEVKKWAGASACETLQINSFDGENFVVIGNCAKPDSGKGEVGDSAQGQIQVTGTISKDGLLMIESIQFAYAG